MAKKVLIVEDNELNMKLFHDLLEAQGYETLQTREGLSALSMARIHKPDLILMDIQLPEISGSWISIRIRSGRCSRAKARAWRPSRVCSVS